MKNKFIKFFDKNYKNVCNNSINEEQFIYNFKLKYDTEKYSFYKLIKKYPQLFDIIFLEYKNKFNDDLSNKIYEELKLKGNKIVEKYMNNIIREENKELNISNKFKEIIEDKTQNIISKNSFEEQIKSKLKLYITDILNDKQIKINNINIILYGTSGQGKTTLINKVLKLEGIERHKTGYGEPITKKAIIITSEKFPTLRFIDTKGINIRNGINILYGINEAKKEVQNIIENQLKGDFEVNIIWYCLSPLNTSNFNEEIKILNQLGNNHKNNKLPIIIVGTKAVEPTFIEELKYLLKKNNIIYPFCPILAEYMCKTEPYGIKELINISIEKTIEMIESSHYKNRLKYIIKKANSSIDECNENINDNISKKKENILNKINDNFNISDLEKEMMNIFDYILDQYFSIDLSNNKLRIININNNINDNIYNNINNDIKICISECLTICKECYEDNSKKIIDLYVEKLVKIFMEEQLNDNIGNIIIDIKTIKQKEYELKNIIKNQLQKKLDIYYFQNIINIYVNLLIENFSLYFINQYKIYISKIEKETLFKDYIISIISNQFNELRNEVDQYNINENSSLSEINDKIREMIISNNGKKDEFAHEENMKKLENEREYNLMKEKFKLEKEENENKIIIQRLENEKEEKELNYKIKKEELNLINEENKRKINLEEKNLELKEQKYKYKFEIEKFSIEKNFELKQLEIKNRHEIQKLHLNNLKEIEIKRLNIHQGEIKLKQGILEKININPSVNQIQQSMPMISNQQNCVDGNIPMNNQFIYNYNYQQQMPVSMMPPPPSNQNFMPNMNYSNSMNMNNFNNIPIDETQSDLNLESNNENKK